MSRPSRRLASLSDCGSLRRLAYGLPIVQKVVGAPQLCCLSHASWHGIYLTLGYEEAQICIVHSDATCDDKLKRLSLLSESSMNRKSLGMLWGLWGA